jgi:hypothetical protein
MPRRAKANLLEEMAQVRGLSPWSRNAALSLSARRDGARSHGATSYRTTEDGQAFATAGQLLSDCAFAIV